MKRSLLLFLCLGLTLGVSAKVTLPELIGNNMVLQQQAEAKLWGWADPRAAVKIETSWGASADVRSDADGRWSAMVKTPAGSYTPQRITIVSGDRVVLENVLIGEVWFAGGQSNMEMPLNGFWNCPTDGANELIAKAGAKRAKLRYVKIAKAQAAAPVDRVPGKWNECTPQTAPWFTATGYFFAEMLNDALDVPVGIIDCSWGGSRVESWTSREVLETYPDIDLSSQGIEAVRDFMRPLMMYNAMLHPLAGYTVKGFIWYQGESNVGRHDDYAQRLANMVALWRSDWQQGELPFYYVEIAPFEYGDGDWGAYLREAQHNARKLIPESGMISTNDLVMPYERRNIHPKNKRDVGYRLAYMALNKTYDMRDVVCESPQFKTIELRDGKAYVSFSFADDGFDRTEGVEGFEICGPDKVFHPAQVEVGVGQVTVFSPQVAEPVAVRYGFRNFQPGNLHNLRGLPVVPFRTDDFRP